MKKRIKRYEGGGDVSLEEKYPGAKITRGEYQGKPAPTPEPKTAAGQMAKEAREEALKKSLEKTAMPEYEQKTEKFEKSSSRGPRGGGGVIPLDKMDKMKKMFYKSGGKVSASKRADGCATKGKTKGKIY